MDDHPEDFRLIELRTPIEDDYVDVPAWVFLLVIAVSIFVTAAALSYWVGGLE